MKRRLQLLSLAALALGASVVAMPAASARDAGTASVVIVHGLRGLTADRYVDGTLLPAGDQEVAVSAPGSPTPISPTRSATQTPTESNGTGGEAIGLGAVAVFFVVATIRRLRRTA